MRSEGSGAEAAAPLPDWVGNPGLRLVRVCARVCVYQGAARKEDGGEKRKQRRASRDAPTGPC